METLILQELLGLIDLGVEVVGVDVQGKADLLDLNDLLVLLGFLFALLLLEAVFAVVQDLAHRRLRLGRDLHQIQVLLLRQTQRLPAGHDAQLAAVCADQANFPVTDGLVDLDLFFAVGSDLDTPPYHLPGKMNAAADFRQPREHTRHTAPKARQSILTRARGAPR